MKDIQYGRRTILTTDQCTNSRTFVPTRFHPYLCNQIGNSVKAPTIGKNIRVEPFGKYFSVTIRVATNEFPDFEYDPD